MKQLIIFRAIQGIGGSAIYSSVIVTISTMVPPVRSNTPEFPDSNLTFIRLCIQQELIATYTPVIGVVFALSSVAGPLVGGAIVSHIHWGMCAINRHSQRANYIDRMDIFYQFAHRGCRCSSTHLWIERP